MVGLAPPDPPPSSRRRTRRECSYPHFDVNSGHAFGIDDFDNKKRGKVGLPEVDTYVGAAKEIFELTGVKERIAGKKKEAAGEGEG